MSTRTLFRRLDRPGSGSPSPITEHALRVSRSFVATALDSERPAWERFSPLLLLATLTTLPLVAVTSGTGSLFVAWLLVAYLLAGYLWIDQAIERADQSHQWRAFLLAGAGLGVVALRLPASAGAVLTTVIGIGAAGAILAGVRVHVPAQPLPWYLLATALVLAEVGHAGAVFWTIRHDAPSPTSGLVSLAGLVLLPIALWLLLHRRSPGSSRTVLLDTAIVTAGLAMLAWVYLIATHTTNPAPATIEQTVLHGWPLIGLAATIVAVRFLLTRWPDDITARQLAGAALVLLIAAITASSWIAAGTTNSALHPGASFLWLLALVGFGAAALHPSMARTTTPIHEQPAELTWQRSLLLTLALIMAPAALLTQSAGGRTTIVVIASGTTLLGLLFAARMITIQHARAATAATDRLLRIAAADLVVTHGRDAILDAAADAARAIGGTTVGTSLYLNDGAPGDFICLRGTDTGIGTRRVIRERDLPRTTRRTLAAGAYAWLSADDIGSARGPLGFPDEVSVVAIAPIYSESELRGLLISAGTGLTHEIARCQETLATLLALALGRQSLADEFGYQPGQQRYRAQAADGTSFTFVEVATPETIESTDAESDAVDHAGNAAPGFDDALRTAIEQDQLLARYQPRLDLTRGRITAVEMTAAWESPLVGPIPRNALSAIAAERGLSQPLRLALLLRACRQAVGWQASHPNRSLDVVLPLSLSDLDSAGLAEDVGLALADSGCDPSRLVLQFSAATLADAGDAALTALSAITAIGVQLTVSEAGASWSELERLCALPVNALEIEASLVTRLDSDERAAAIATHLIALAHRHGACVIAHGIDRRETWVQLRKLGCDLGQGTLFSPPLDAGGVSTLLDRAQQRHAQPQATL